MEKVSEKMWVMISLEKGGQGGYPRVTTAWCAVPGRLSSATFRIGPTYWPCLLTPPTPLLKGGTYLWRASKTRVSNLCSEVDQDQLFTSPGRG